MRLNLVPVTSRYAPYGLSLLRGLSDGLFSFRCTQLNVTSCTTSASATVPAFYTGSVWFDYGSTRDGHFKWSLNIDAVLPADQRSDNMTLTDKVNIYVAFLSTHSLRSVADLFPE